MQAWVGLFLDDLWPATLRTIEAMERWPGSQEPNESGFSIANDSTDPFFPIMAKDPERLKRYGTAMAAQAAAGGFEVEYLVENYPWAELGEATVVDVSLSLTKTWTPC